MNTFHQRIIGHLRRYSLGATFFTENIRQQFSDTSSGKPKNKNNTMKKTIAIITASIAKKQAEVAGRLVDVKVAQERVAQKQEALATAERGLKHLQESLEELQPNPMRKYVGKTVVVSPNYHDRSRKTWLIRLHEEDASQAIEVSQATIHDFRFTNSNAYEAGFGCNIVAKGTFSDAQLERGGQAVDLKFDGGHRFYENGIQRASRQVDAGKVLGFQTDGGIVALK